MILTAPGVDLEGNKEVLARRPCAEEDKEGWMSVLHDEASARSDKDSISS
jgi:transposase-like protein